MTKIKDGLGGTLSGKLGNFIMGVWKDIPYMKKAPVLDKNRKRSINQIASQEKFKYTNELLVPFHPFLNVGFKNVAEKKTEISAAFSLNYRHAVEGIYPDLSVAFEAFKISTGDLSNLTEPIFELIHSDVLTLTWLMDRLKGSAFNDQVMLAIYCPELHAADGFIGKVQRSELNCDFKFNPRFIGKEMHVYVSVVSEDRKKIAESMYLGKIDAV